MEIIKDKNRTRLTQAALGKIPCDLSINNIQLVNVFTGEIYPAGVDVLDGVIVRVRMNGQECELPSKTIVDGEGQYLLPGFIDVHMHVESTMMIPENFGKAAVVWGTTTAVTDPHEIGNVMGIPGVLYMLQSAKYSPLRIFTLVPSCVPAVPSVESAGASFGPVEVKHLLELPNVIGIAEVMDYIGVINDDPHMHGIIDAGKAVHGFIQGHAPQVSGNDLCAYLCGGPVSDHEVRYREELVEKLRMGMHVNIKSSSLSDTVHEFLKGVQSIPLRNLVSFCTDDVHAADLLSTGHINHIANECYKGGFDPIEIIRFGTINAAHELGFEDIGAIAPNYVADFQLVKDLTFAERPISVWIAGKRIEEDDSGSSYNINFNSVDIPQVTSPDVFKMNFEDDKKYLVFNASRMAMVPGQQLVYKSFDKLDFENENQFIAIVNRYGNGGITKVVCSNFNLKHGCVASTISHDSHNMTIAYKDPYDAYVAAKALQDVGGGMVFVENGEVKYILPLPVGGLMSSLPVKELAPKIEEMSKWVDYASDGQSPMLLAIAILALPVRPGIIITDKGVIRGETLQFVPQVIDK